MASSKTPAPGVFRLQRRLLDYSLQQVARHTGTSITTIAQFEKGQRRLSPERLRKLAAMLSVALPEDEGADR